MQPLSPRSRVPRRVGGVVALAGLAAAAGVVAFRLLERRHPAEPVDSDNPEIPAARRLNGAAAILAFSVFADSAVEHYRGGFHNPAMFIAPTVAAISLANSVHMTAAPEVSGAGRLALSALTFATGLAGLGYHLYNVAKREGGISLANLFYAAPLGAPAAIATSGAFAMAAARLVAEAEAGSPPTLLRRPAAIPLAIGATVALLGTAAEAALLHFRGAFHDPFMFVPVTLPPTAAAVLAAALLRPRLRRAARLLLRLTGIVGVAGAGFHIYGVSRNMGGFYNWSQNVLNGPPIPAPPAFTGVALAGLAAVRLMEAR